MINELQNQDGSWMVWGKNHERSRSCGTVLVRRAFGLWYYRNRVDCEAMCGSLCCWNDYEVFECEMCKSLSLLYVCDALCVEVGDLTKNVSRLFKLIVAMINSKQWPILAIQTVFGSEPAWMGESLKCFRKVWVIWWMTLPKETTKLLTLMADTL